MTNKVFAISFATVGGINIGRWIESGVETNIWVGLILVILSLVRIIQNAER